MNNNVLITVLGPTASGKTRFGASLAYHLDGEIISADSRQVYREMNIGTGKDYDDYLVNDKKIPGHLVDIHEPGYQYNVYEFQNDFIQAFNHIVSKKRQPFLVGGTGLYIQAVLEKYKLTAVPVNKELRDYLSDKSQEALEDQLKQYPQHLHNTTDLVHRKRTIRAIEIADYYLKHDIQDPDYPDFKPLIFGVKFDRNSQRRKITERLKKRFDEGMIDEVRRLLLKLKPEDLIFYGLEYKFITLYLTGKLNYEEMFRQLEVSIHQFAKRQMTWFRRMERQGHRIHWFDGHQPLNEKVQKAYGILEQENNELIKKWQTSPE